MNYGQASNVNGTPFQPAYLNKCFADGAEDSYLGLRASHEEDYTRQTHAVCIWRGFIICAGKNDINELVNLPDVIGMEIMNGELFALSAKRGSASLTSPVVNYVAMSGLQPAARYCAQPSLCFGRTTAADGAGNQHYAAGR